MGRNFETHFSRLFSKSWKSVDTSFPFVYPDRCWQQWESEGWEPWPLTHSLLWCWWHRAEHSCLPNTQSWVPSLFLIHVEFDCFPKLGFKIIKIKIVSQLVKNPPAMQETPVRSLGWKDPLVEGMATHSSILAWRIPMNKGAWQATVHGIAKSQTWLSD